MTQRGAGPGGGELHGADARDHLHGRRLLGDGKTWRGTAAGTLAGTALALLLTTVAAQASDIVGYPLPAFPLGAGLGLAFGAMVGDIAASFLKRRSGRERGASYPGLDQLDFVVGALAGALLFAPSWTLATFSLPIVVAVLVVTPLLHVVTNVIAYLLGAKNEPW
jgi:CDP-2,3-bis-(O-geranylgeranyl)-sn-glycerol synthase